MRSIINLYKYLGNNGLCLSTITGLLIVNSSYINAQTENSALLEEIVVTATKKKNVENIHDVPAAVTAFGANQLDALKVRDLVGLNFAVPNASIEEIGTTKGSASFAIRGLGINSSIPSIEPTVGVFVDGIYYGINTGVVFDTFDIDSIEILRGPQGVLFGRNVTGGAVVLNTSDPSFEASTKIKIAAESGFRGTGENFIIQGSTTGTLIEDTLAGKIAVYYNDDQGWFENIQLDGSKTDFGENDSLIIRPALTWTPSDIVSVTAKYEYGEFSGDGPAAQSHTNGFGVDGQVVNFDRNSFDFSINDGTFNDSQWNNLSLETNIDVAFGDGRITNIFGYRDFESTAFSDIDATPLSIFHGEIIIEQDQISNELRYNGQFGKLNVTTGLFYFEQDIAYAETRFLGENTFLVPFVASGGGTIEQRTIGLFAQAEYEINDRLTLSAGLRYSDERKDAELALIFPGLQSNTDCRITNNDCRIDFSNETNPGDARFETDNLSPQLGFQYTLSDTTNIYGKWSRSFRAGGFNLRNAFTNAGDLESFDDEEVNSFELGWKLSFENGTRFNAAIFKTEIDDLQREVNTTDPIAGIVQIVRNTANAEIFGIEIDGQFPLSDNLIFTMSAGILDGDYEDIFFDLSGDGVINEQDFALEIPRLTDISASVGLIYQQRIGDLGDGHLQINYGRKSETPYNEDNRAFQTATSRLDASFTLHRDSGTSVSLYGKNITNEVLHASDAQLPSSLLNNPLLPDGIALGGTFAPLTKGRVIGIELQHEF